MSYGHAVFDDALLGFGAGLVLAVATAPVGVSGAVFLLPFQLSVLHVPSPALTPTNLLYNVVSVPGALVRYGRRGDLTGPLSRALVAGTLPAVVVGAAIRVFVVPGVDAFRLIAATVLLPLGLWLCFRASRRIRPRQPRNASGKAMVTLGAMAGLVGGLYGLGGGSIIGPILVARGLPLSRVAPAALGATLVTSVAGFATYLLLSLTTTEAAAPDWVIGVGSGIGGLIGGYIGAWMQPHLPERALTVLLGVLAAGIGVLYVAQSAM